METNQSYTSGGDTSLTTQDLSNLTKGWSVKDDILGKDIYNDNNDNIGTIQDLYVTRDKAISYAVLGVGGFLGMGRHDVAIPVYQLRMTNDQIMLPGATQDSLKAMPAID
ncbi:PRC-barrel domain-containing protein [Fundidesulfovibrio putealis]|uniref:PRC-barrel domain-containing protein n=1 Tax=Fundidesulfovibrio putealis TaxID=270496 RepID=UPI000484B4D2|nr:PRC-barrel domain-containing protein [Fundidesulfovibrio putealis]